MLALGVGSIPRLVGEGVLDEVAHGGHNRRAQGVGAAPQVRHQQCDVRRHRPGHPADNYI